MDDETPRLNTDLACLALLAPMLSAEAEQVVAAHIDADYRLLGITRSEPAGRSRVVVPMRAIVADALGHNSHGVVLAHNHPGGDPTPSPQDIAVTRQLATALRAIEVRLYEHLIIAGDAHVSFSREGWL